MHNVGKTQAYEAVIGNTLTEKTRILIRRWEYNNKSDLKGNTGISWIASKWLTTVYNGELL